MAPHPYESVSKTLDVEGKQLHYFSLKDLKDERLDRLPYSIRVLLEAAVRKCDNFSVHTTDVEKILDWENKSKSAIEIPFTPARVILQDFTGVPAVVDLAAMRDAMKRLGGDPSKINPLVPVDLVIDHSVVVDSARSAESLKTNQEMEFERNSERFEFLKWGSKSFENMLIVPPGSGIVHQVNLEYLARSVFEKDNVLYPDSLVGTDSHTTMINGLGVLGWGVGGIEAEAVMLGQPMSMVLPQVVGFKLSGDLAPQATATDLVLTIVQMLRQLGVVGKFVEFFGPGVAKLSVADRATIANMAPEYGATCGFFPVDEQTIDFLRQTGRDEFKLKCAEAYFKAQGLFTDYSSDKEPSFSAVLELDLSTVVPCVSGPKRPHDRVPVSDMKADFSSCLTNKVGFKGFGLTEDQLSKVAEFEFEGQKHSLKHGSVVIAAITSCTNTSNPSVMIGAGLVCKKAVELGLSIKPYIKTSLSPGSHVVSRYLDNSGLTSFMDQIGFNTAGYGCMTCIGNSGEIPQAVSQAISDSDLVAAAVLSGNRNFEGRVHPQTRANYLASPPLVVAYALAGRVDLDFSTEPLGIGKDGKEVFLKDVWPTHEEVQEVIAKSILPKMYQEVYESITKGTPKWNSLNVPESLVYPWKDSSTYIHNPPFFQTMGVEPQAVGDVKDAYCLLNLGDSITTDHISPAGTIAKGSPAERYLIERGVEKKDFNSYGARRGNDEIMARGTFANIRLLNKFIGKAAALTVHIPSGEQMSVFDAAMKYKEAGQSTIVLAGAEYGSGSSRDWAAKGPYLQGIKAVIAVSYERIHRSNLVGMGIVPLQFKEGQSADVLGLTGKERFDIQLPETLAVNATVPVTARADDGKETAFETVLRFDTPIELEYYRHGGILHFVLRGLLK